MRSGTKTTKNTRATQPGAAQAKNHLVVSRTKTSLVIAAVAILLSGCRGPTYRISSDAMAPTLKVGDVIFADERAYKNASPRRGDIVVVKAPDDSPNSQNQIFPQRVIGVGGDKIQVAGGKVLINDQLLVMGSVFGSGKYDSPQPVEDFGPVIVPEDQYFLVGDNLPLSRDSRHWKHSSVTKESIVGKVITVKEVATGNMRSF